MSDAISPRFSLKSVAQLYRRHSELIVGSKIYPRITAYQSRYFIMIELMISRVSWEKFLFLINLKKIIKHFFLQKGAGYSMGIMWQSAWLAIK